MSPFPPDRRQHRGPVTPNKKAPYAGASKISKDDSRQKSLPLPFASSSHSLRVLQTLPIREPVVSSFLQTFSLGSGWPAVGVCSPEAAACPLVEDAVCASAGVDAVAGEACVAGFDVSAGASANDAVAPAAKSARPAAKSLNFMYFPLPKLLLRSKSLGELALNVVEKSTNDGLVNCGNDRP